MSRFLHWIFRRRMPMIEVTDTDGQKTYVAWNAVIALKPYANGTYIVTAAAEYHISEPLDVIRKKLGFVVGRISFQKNE